MITELKLNSLDNKPIEVKKSPVPQSINKSLPPLFMNAMFIGAKNTGKTYSLCKLLQNYEKYPIYDHQNNKLETRVIIFCPTFHSTANPILKTLKNLDEEDIVLNYSDDKLLDKIDEIEFEYNHINEYSKYIKAYKKFNKYEDTSRLNEDELLLLHKNDFMSPDDLPNKPKYKHPRVNFMIFDDLVGTNAFKIKANSALNNFVIKHRHLRCNLFFTTQYPRAIPPVIRNNVDVWVLFKSASKERVLDQIYPEISNLITEDNFTEMYEHATQDGHDSLVIINHNLMDKRFRFRKNWDIVLSIH